MDKNFIFYIHTVSFINILGISFCLKTRANVEIWTNFKQKFIIIQDRFNISQQTDCKACKMLLLAFRLSKRYNNVM